MPSHLHQIKMIGLPPIAEDWSLGFEHTSTRQASEYWRSQCGAREMPSRADISPEGMRAFLSHIGLIEVRQSSEQTCDYFIRVMGTKLEQVFGHLSGHRLRDVVAPEFEARWRKGYDAVRMARRPLRTSGLVAFDNQTWLASETLLAPLSDGHDAVSMLFVAFASWPNEGMTPPQNT